MIPRLGAVAIGYLAKSPINKQPIALARAVAVKTAPLSIPEAPKISGLTNKIYAIEMKVVKPARISRFTLVLRPVRSK